MFVVWGKKKTSRQLGYVADFCIFCRSIRPFRVKAIREVSHLYFIPLGGGEEVCQVSRCTGCGWKQTLEPATYGSFVRDRHADINTLVWETNPHLLENLKDRLILEERAKQSLAELTREERAGLLEEPLLELSQRIEQLYGGETHIGTETGLALLATLGLAIAFLITGPIAQRPGEAMATAGVVLGVLSALSLAGTIYLLATQCRRYMKRHIVPLLARALARLEPTRAELADVLEDLKTHGLAIGRKLKPEWVLDSMRVVRARATEEPAKWR